MLAAFLTKNQSEILALTREKIAAVSESRPTSEALEEGLLKFYEYLIAMLKRAPHASQKAPIEVLPKITSQRGEELSRLGYTVSQVVHSYGAICQSITEMAQRKRVTIASREFNALNYSLDVAIAEAVTKFEEMRHEASSRSETQRLGFLAHELRNALTNVSVAHYLIKRGVVGNAGMTNALLEQSLARMQDLIDRSLTEVRLRSELEADRHPLRLMEIIDGVEATAIPQARQKDVSLTVRVNPNLEVNADRQHLVSAVANLVQNAIKFSRAGGSVIVRGHEDGPSIVLEVQDSCGGLPAGNIEDLFKPFTQKGVDRTGLGLGLAISRRALLLNGGVLSARDLPGQGCIFSIRLPKLDPNVVRAESLPNAGKTDLLAAASGTERSSPRAHGKLRRSSPS